MLGVLSTLARRRNVAANIFVPTLCSNMRITMDTLIHEIRKKAETISFSGVISIFESEKDLYNEAFGYADIANSRKNTLTTKFGIASGTKLLTALGIGTLIDQGRITLKSRIHDIFQQELTWVDAQATISHLLNHTSGIFDYYDEELITDWDNFLVDIPWYQLETPTDYLPLFEDKEAKFLPNERFSYSNGGYICLGIIIEKSTHQRYRDYIGTSVFAPAQMSDSGYYAFHNLPENTAYGYRISENGTNETNIYNLPLRGASDGGAYTTTFDLRKLWRTLLNNTILSDKLTSIFLSPQVRIDDSVDYGYGLYISQLKNMDMFYIVGGDAGVGFDSRYVPEKELLVNILSNTTNGEEEIRKVIYHNLEKAL